MSLKQRVAAGLVALGTLVAVAPAHAAHGPQIVSPSISYIETGDSGYRWVHQRYRNDRLSPRELRRTLRHQGYRLVDILDRTPRSYTVQAENYRGRSYILQVSARSGVILSARPLRHRAGGRRHHERDEDRHDRPRRDDERCWLPEGCY